MRMAKGRVRLARFVSISVLVSVTVTVAAHAGESERQVERDIERFVRARIAGGESGTSKTSIEVPPLATFAIDRERHPGPLRTEISTRAREPLRGRVPLAVELYAGDLLVKRAVVSPYVRRTERVVVPTRDLRPGTIVGSGDFVYVDRDATRLPRGVVRDKSEVVGLRVRRSLRKDRVVRSSQVEGVPVVERGDRVQIVLESGSLRISASGKAQEKGALGDWIRVVNVDSKRELSGRVDAEGRVHVAF